MRPVRLSTTSLVASLVALGLTLAIAPTSAGWRAPAARRQVQTPRGHSDTRLADGRRLLVGGESPDGGVVGSATIVDPSTGAATRIPTTARAWHTATLLPDSTVLIAGGQGVAGQAVTSVDLFDPTTNVFIPLGGSAGVARSGHTATVLTDGRVFVAGGTGADGEPRADAEVWQVDGSTLSVIPVAAPVRQATGVRDATLLADGRVLLRSEAGPGEVFDPVTQQIVPADAPAPDSGPAALAEARPADGAVDVAIDGRFALRFTQPLRPDSVTPATVTLTGPDGPVDAQVVATDEGRLVFVTPRAALAAGAEYVLGMRGAVDARGTAVAVSVRVTTRKDPPRDVADHEAWVPDAADSKHGWRTNRPDAPAASLPPLTAPAGTTALAGQVLRLDGQPLQGVTLELAGHDTRTDRTGRFLLLLPGVATGRHELEIDGRTANRGPRTYGTFEYGLTITSGHTTVLPFTIWMPRLDTAHQVAIPSPTTQETVITTPYIPGLELHLPAGTTIRDEEGKVVRAVSITPIPVDRPPFPLATNVDVPVYFTVQPGGAYVSTAGNGPKGAWLVYPNYRHERAGKPIQFFHYDPEVRGWYVYGLGTVTANQAQVVPDPTTRIYAFTGAMINSGWSPPADAPSPGDSCSNDADPVNLRTGLFMLDQTDVVLPDVLPIAITRSYRTRDLDSRPFGIGTTHPYAMFLWSAQQYQQADLILPDGAKIHYVRTSPGTSWVDAVFEHKETETTSATPTAFYTSVMTWNGHGWDVRLKDGTVYVFGENAPLQAIRDRYGNAITVQHADGQQGNITRVISPFGRWFELTYDPSDRITQVTDNSGRT